jgi:ElaB/YqjD/DUF883 family membrane-anchored ribosome-binding protein
MTSYTANRKPASDLNLVLRNAEDLLKATAGAGSENMKEVRCRLALAVASAKAAYDRLKEMTVKSAEATDHVIREFHISPLRSPEAVKLVRRIVISWLDGPPFKPELHSVLPIYPRLPASGIRSRMIGRHNIHSPELCLLNDRQ